jgi:hypothetical protein
MIASLLLATSISLITNAAPSSKTSKNALDVKTGPLKPAECVQVSDPVDRKYFFDKNLQSIQKGLDKEKKSWENGLSSESKESKISSLTTQIENTKELIGMYQSEVAMKEQLLTELNSFSKKKSSSGKKKKKKDNQNY